MSLTDVILPVWVKPLVLALLVAAIWGHGYHKGILHGERVLDGYKTSVSQAATAAETRTFKRIILQKEISEQTQTKLENRLAIANRRYNGLLHSAPNGGIIVPPVSETPARIDEKTTSIGIPVTDYNRIVDNYNQLANDCTATTIIADEWQNWAVENLKE